MLVQVIEVNIQLPNEFIEAFTQLLIVGKPLPGFRFHFEVLQKMHDSVDYDVIVISTRVLLPPEEF